MKKQKWTRDNQLGAVSHLEMDNLNPQYNLKWEVIGTMATIDNDMGS